MKFYIDLGVKGIVLLSLISLLQGEFIMAYVALYIGYWVIIANLLQIKKQGCGWSTPTTIATNIFIIFLYRKTLCIVFSKYWNNLIIA